MSGGQRAGGGVGVLFECREIWGRSDAARVRVWLARQSGSSRRMRERLETCRVEASARTRAPRSGVKRLSDRDAAMQDLAGRGGRACVQGGGWAGHACVRGEE